MPAQSVTPAAVEAPQAVPSSPGATPPAVKAPAKTADAAETAKPNKPAATQESFDGDAEVGEPGWDEL